MIGLCRSEHRIIWISILFVYKGILLVVGVFLAFETRNVKIRHLNDSKLIGMSVYMMLVLSISLGAVGLLLETHVDTFYAVVGLMIMIGNTSLLCLIFIPKVGRSLSLSLSLCACVCGGDYSQVTISPALVSVSLLTVSASGSTMTSFASSLQLDLNGLIHSS